MNKIEQESGNLGDEKQSRLEIVNARLEKIGTSVGMGDLIKSGNTDLAKEVLSLMEEQKKLSKP